MAELVSAYFEDRNVIEGDFIQLTLGLDAPAVAGEGTLLASSTGPLVFVGQPAGGYVIPEGARAITVLVEAQSPGLTSVVATSKVEQKDNKGQPKLDSSGNAVQQTDSLTVLPRVPPAPAPGLTLLARELPITVVPILEALGDAAYFIKGDRVPFRIERLDTAKEVTVLVQADKNYFVPEFIKKTLDKNYPNIIIAFDLVTAPAMPTNALFTVTMTDAAGNTDNDSVYVRIKEK